MAQVKTKERLIKKGDIVLYDHDDYCVVSDTTKETVCIVSLSTGDTYNANRSNIIKIQEAIELSNG